MNNIIKQIEVDVYSPTFYEVIKAQQGDKNSRFVEFILFNQGEPYTVPDNTIVKLEGSRANKSPIIKPCIIKDNSITIELDADLLYYHGISHLKLVLYEENEKSILSTIPFTLSVQKNPLDSDKFEKDNYSLLNQLILETVTVNKNLEKHMSDNDDPHTIMYEEADTLSKLTVGEKLSDTFGKLSKAVSDLIAHINDNIRHITSEERENWDDARDKRHVHSNKNMLDNTTASYTAEEKNKLVRIQDGAQVNVQSDWNISDSNSDAYIKNKPPVYTRNEIDNKFSCVVNKSGDIMTGILYNATPCSDNRTTSMSSDGFVNHVPRGGYAGGMKWVDQEGNVIGNVGLYKDFYYYIGNHFRNPDGILKLNKVVGDLEGVSDQAKKIKFYESNKKTSSNTWYKVCSMTIEKRYDDSYANFIVSQLGTPDNYINFMEIVVRLKQQNPMGEEPFTDICVTKSAGEMGPDDVAMHISKNDEDATTADIYCRIKPTYGLQKTAVILSSNSVVFFEYQPLLDSLPIGISKKARRYGSVQNAYTLAGKDAALYALQYNDTQDANTKNANEICSLGHSINMMLQNETDNPVGKKAWYHIWSQAWSKSPDAWVSQIAIDVQNSSGMYYRNSLADKSIVGRPWVKLLDEYNLPSFIHLKNIALGGELSNKSWVDAGEITAKQEYFLRVYRVDTSCKQEWVKNDWGSAFIFGSHDTRGCISMSHSIPGLKLAGGNRNSVWNMEITGTKGKVYNLETIQNTVSDERDKTDFVPLNSEKSLEFLLNLKPLSFVSNMRDKYSKNMEDFTEEEWDNYSKYGFKPYDKEAHSRGDKKGERRRVGVSAQETIKALEKIYGSSDVANIVNENLHGFGDKIPDDVETQYSITYESFIPYLISAIQELSDIVKKQSKRIEELENYID